MVFYVLFYATFKKHTEIHDTLGFQYCQQSKNFNSKPLKLMWTWWTFDGVAFFVVVDCFFNCPQIHWLPEEEHGVWLPWQSKPHPS